MNDFAMGLTPKPLLLLLSILLLTKQRVGALRLLNVTVPPYLKKGESARLECRYDLESDKLYSVSWYKDNEHIYRYLKKHNTKNQYYSIEGVRIDTHRSNSQVLHLLGVSLDSTGYYACEVNTDSKPFKSVKGEVYMEVIDPPREDPKITGEERIYSTGDILSLNCTSGFSHPAAQLRWYINEVPVDSPDVEVWHSTSRGLHSTRSSLRLALDPFHLVKDRIEVQCISTVRTSDLVKTPFEDIRIKKIYVQGQANLSMPSISLLLVTLLILTRLRMD